MTQRRRTRADNHVASRLRIERIEWTDHWSDAGWISHNEIKGAPPESGREMVSVGFVLDDKGDEVVISTTASGWERSIDPLHILKTAIKRRRRLK